MSITPLKYQVSRTVSPAAATEMANYFHAKSSPGGEPPKSQADWDKLAAEAEREKRPLSDAFASKLGVHVQKDRLGGVDVLRITPPGHDHRERRLLIYTHGGGYVVFSAEVELVLPTLMATSLGVEVVSVDYTIAPRGNYQSVTDQIVSVYKAVLDEGRSASAVGMYGDSAGGGITLASVLKMRDHGIPLPGALYLVSPSTDISQDGDSRISLADADPILPKSAFPLLSKAYAPDGDERHPYASPVHGDYGRPFPPTLIQGGTREILISDFVRFYQAMIQGGNEAVLDLYEGMCHVFQARFPEVPETVSAIRRARDFLRSKLAAVA